MAEHTNYNKNVFFLNLNRAYPTSMLPKTTTVAQLFYTQCPYLTYLIPQRAKGVYKIQCKNEDESQKLKSFKLKVCDETAKQVKEIPLEEPRVRRPKGSYFDNGTLITIQGSCENGMEAESNEEFDKFFQQYGTIVKNTWYTTYKGNKQLNGNRALVLQLQHGLSIERKVFYEGPNSGIKGQIRVFYKGQPYYCNLCQEIHNTNCPKRQEEK